MDFDYNSVLQKHTRRAGRLGTQLNKMNVNLLPGANFQSCPLGKMGQNWLITISTMVWPFMFLGIIYCVKAI